MTKGVGDKDDSCGAPIHADCFTQCESDALNRSAKVTDFLCQGRHSAKSDPSAQPLLVMRVKFRVSGNQT